jgi:hypothetical protein
VVACCPLPQSGDDAGEAREGHRHLCDNEQEVSVSHVPPNGSAFSCVAAACDPTEAPSFNARHYHGAITAG